MGQAYHKELYECIYNVNDTELYKILKESYNITYSSGSYNNICSEILHDSKNITPSLPIIN